jgi:hypothetical protein
MGRISTLFNPLVRTDQPNGWLEDLYTSPPVKMISSEEADEFVSMFGFEGISDASQPSYIRQGIKKFINNSSFLLSRSFDLSVKLTTEGRQVTTLHCVGTEEGISFVEEAMRGMFEQPNPNDVDSRYCFPNLISHISGDKKYLGWLESGTGSFLFTDPRCFQKMSSVVNANSLQLV